MCAIVDANVASRFFSVPPDPQLLPLWEWINDGRGVLVVGGRLLTELSKVRDAANAIQEWQRVGRAAIVDASDVAAEEREVEKSGLCVSNDKHVIALARVSGARLLCARDNALRRDFKNPQLIKRPLGKVYRSPRSAYLLKHATSCRFAPPRSRGGPRKR